MPHEFSNGSMLFSSWWKNDGASKEVGSERYGEYVEGIGNIEMALCAV